MIPLSNNIRLTRRDMLIGVLIVLLAFTLRVIVVFDRAANDSGFDPPPDGSDQRHYLAYAAGWEAGTWPTEPFWYQPGLVYYFVGIRAIVGTSLGNMRLLTSLVGALACGLILGIGWMLTSRRWVGYLAGMLLAVYPVAIFYSTELLDTGLSTFYVTLFLFLVLWQKYRLTLWRTIALSLTLGLAIITRTNLALLWLAWLVFLGFYARRRAFFLHTAVSFVALAIPIAPVTLWNVQNGSSQLITRVGMEEIYRASSRDSNGIYVSRFPAFEVVDDSKYVDALIYDALRDPRRFIELQIRKLSLYWSAIEPGNNIDYVQNGENVSPLLRAIPLDFRILSAVGFLGLLALLYTDRRMGMFFAVLILMLFAGVMVIWIEARMRQPVIVPLIILAVFFIVQMGEIVRASQWKRLGRQVALPALVLFGLFAYFDWAIDHLPQQRPISNLPADTRRLDLIFDGRLKLVGWRPLDEWPAANRGWGLYGQSYVIQLFWEILEPTSEDYNTYIAYNDDGQRYAGRDTVIGAISYLPQPTSSWTPGEIYGEILGFKLPDTIPTGQSGEINLGVYRTEGEFTYQEDTRRVFNVPATSLESQPGYIALQKFAIFDSQQSPPSFDGFVPADHIFDDRINLKGVFIPASSQPDSTVTLSFYWEALTDIDRDYSLFVHVMDQDNQLAAQYDGEPLLVTSTWSPDYPVREDIQLKLPASSGIYTLYAGLYDPQTGDRLPVDALDNRVRIGSIEVSGG